jgi:hypothetical protein
MTCTRGNSYTIKAGDTLFIIADKKLGDGNRWREILKPDGSQFTEVDARNLQPGQEICIPESVSTPNDMVQEILAAHNKYRSEVGIPSLRWSNNLASSAQQWANQLAATGRFEHSRSGENLWKGTAGRFSFTQMVDSWGNEKRFFLPNRNFPDVSSTGNWQDVGHYTQIVWRNTTEVGGGIATGGGSDILVCHYNPVGNVIGQRVF